MREVILNVLPIIISIIALGTSLIIGIKQFKISKRQIEISKLQSDAQNKVELYLLSAPITLRKACGSVPDKIVPGIYIRNIGNNVVYLDKYSFNGKEYPLYKEVLPPVSSFDGYHYLYLPTDNTTHVSLTVDFYDWQSRLWRTKGFADLRDGMWEITYSPCEPQ